MAAKKKKKTAKKGKVVVVADLVEETGIPGTKIRQIIRGLGMVAPSVEREDGAFGPRAKYEWSEGSADLKKIRKALEDAEVPTPREPKEKKGKKGKGKGKKAAAEEEDEEDEEDEEEEDEDFDDEDDDE